MNCDEDPSVNDEQEVQHTPHMENLTFITNLNINQDLNVQESLASETLRINLQSSIHQLRKLSFSGQKMVEANSFKQLAKQMILFRFYLKLRLLSGNVSIDAVKQQHLNIINDLGADSSGHIYKGQSINRLIRHNQSQMRSRFEIDWASLLERLLNLLPILMPNSIFSLSMDFLIIIVTLAQLLFVPILMAFQTNRSFIYDAQIYIYGLLTFDIFRQQITGVFINGVLILKPEQIIRQYFKQNFVFDLVTILLYWISFSQIYLKMLFLLRILKINQLVARLQMAVSFHNYNVIGLIQLFFVMIFTTQLMSCLMYLLEESTSTLWEQPTISDSITEIYFQCLYWAVATMTTVGYGDVVPMTNTQKMYTMGVMIVGVCLFGYMLNNIGNILQQINNDHKEHTRYILKHDSYFETKPLTEQLKIKMKQYAEHHYRFNCSNINQKDNFLAIVSKELQCEYKEQVNGRVLRSQRFLLSFNLRVQTEILNLLEQQFYLPTDIIIDQSFDFFILEEGIIDWRYNQSTVETYSKPYQAICLVEFITGFTLKGQLQSQDFTSVFYLSRNKFLEVIKEHQVEFELFSQIQNEIIFKNSFQSIYLICSVCLSNTHLINNCPKMHFVANKERIIREGNKHKDQKRRYMVRSYFKSQTLRDLYHIQAITMMFYDDNEDLFGELVNLNSFASNTYINDRISSNGQLNKKQATQVRMSSIHLYNTDNKFPSNTDVKYLEAQTFSQQQEQTVYQLDRFCIFRNYYCDFNVDQVIQKLNDYRKRYKTMNRFRGSGATHKQLDLEEIDKMRQSIYKRRNGTMKKKQTLNLPELSMNSNIASMSQDF